MTVHVCHREFPRLKGVVGLASLRLRALLVLQLVGVLHTHCLLHRFQPVNHKYAYSFEVYHAFKEVRHQYLCRQVIEFMEFLPRTNVFEHRMQLIVTRVRENDSVAVLTVVGTNHYSLTLG